MRTRRARFRTYTDYDRKIAAMRQLQRELGVMPLPDIRIRTLVTGADGQVVHDRHEQGHSWVRNAWNIWTVMMTDCSGVAGSTSTPIGGNFREGFLTFKALNSGIGSLNQVATRSTIQAANGFFGALGSQLPGIIIGTSTEPFSADDYNLWQPISQGTGAGQMVHNTMAWPSLTYNSGTKQHSVALTRVFNNNSGGGIAVNEVGLVYRYNTLGDTLMSRDVLVSPVTVPNAAQLTISIDLISPAFTSLEASAVSQPAIGATLGGGTNLGAVPTWASSANLPVGGSFHPRFALILSPASGGDSAPVQWRTTGASLVYTTDNAWGSPNTSSWLALGASNVPAVGVASTQNAASLGGFTDWYVPTFTEMGHIRSCLGSIAGGEQPQNASYWYADSFGSGSISGGTYNPATGTSASGIGMTSTARVRLVRRHRLP